MQQKLKGKVKWEVLSTNNSEGESGDIVEIAMSPRVENGDGGRGVGRMRISLLKGR